MCAQILKRKGTTSHVISSLNKCRKQSDKKVTYEGFDYIWHSSAFRTLVRLSDEIPEYAKNGIVWGALKSPTKSGKMNYDQLQNALSEEEEKYKRKKIKTYYLKIDLSINGELPFKKLNFDEVTFLFDYKMRCDPIPDHILRNLPFHGALPEGYKSVLVQVKAKTYSDASHIAVEKLDILRGFWNFMLNQHFRMSSGKRRPVNEITSGPFYVSYTAQGKFIEGELMHDPTFVIGAEIRDLTPISSKLRKETLSFQKRMNHSAFKKIICNALVRYARALDRIDYEHAIVELWSILESLTLTSEYDLVVNRAGSIYSNHVEATSVIDHLRLRRNDIVHRTASFQDTESLVFQLKSVIEGLLSKYIGMFSNTFSTKNELTTFLDMPRDAEMLKIGQNFIRK